MTKACRFSEKSMHNVHKKLRFGLAFLERPLLKKLTGDLYLTKLNKTFDYLITVELDAEGNIASQESLVHFHQDGFPPHIIFSSGSS